MGNNCYCNIPTESGNIHVPPLDKTEDVSNNNIKNDESIPQEAYNRIFTIKKNELKSVPSNVEENENNDNNIINLENFNDIDNNNDKNKKNNKEDKVKEMFDKGLKVVSKEITEEEFSSLIDQKIKNIENNLQPINDNEKKKYCENKEKSFIFKPPLVFNKTNIKYFGSWNPIIMKKEGWGILVDQDGNKYEGGWENDMINGYGRLISINGDYYEGEIKSGVFEGNGIFYSNESKMIYKGEFKNNLFEGRGEQIFEDGEVKLKYEGMFKEGKREGKGKFIFGDGSIYEGDFSNDRFDGEGSFKWNNGREYKGHWKDNQINGKGNFSWNKDTWYEGDYKDNRREGFGTYHFGENKYYEGKWRNNLPHGEGKYCENGKIIEGLFRFGKIIRKNNGKKK
jgi:hypothetical protein